MENNRLPSGSSGRELDKNIEIKGTFYRKCRVFAAFIICAAILTAAFAASSIWSRTESGKAFFGKIKARFFQSQSGNEPPPVTNQIPSTSDSDIQKDPVAPLIPTGAIPILTADLSYLSKGEAYFVNETPYTPSVSALLGRYPNLTVPRDSTEPLVLIVHTHTVESYKSGNEPYFSSSPSEETYSQNEKENMPAVGKVLCERLNQNGIPTLQCTVIHTGEDMSLQGSYDRSKESIEAYLRQYPSIQLVIDLHRDAIMTENGSYIQTALPNGDGSMAQVMAVVGTDCNGTEHDRWEENLSLALHLRRELNTAHSGIARPVYLRNSSFNQECAPYSLLLEIGTGANSLEQAKRTAEEVGDALTALFVFEADQS